MGAIGCTSRLRLLHVRLVAARHGALEKCGGTVPLRVIRVSNGQGDWVDGRTRREWEGIRHGDDALIRAAGADRAVPLVYTNGRCAVSLRSRRLRISGPVAGETR